MDGCNKELDITLVTFERLWPSMTVGEASDSANLAHVEVECSRVCAIRMAVVIWS